MKKVLILMASHWGHYNATYCLSSDLKSLGYEVIYLAENRFKETIIAQGFKFQQYNFINAFFDINHFDWRLFVNTFFKSLKESLKDSRFKTFKANVYILEETINSISPDLLLIDSFLFLQTAILTKNKTKIILIETMLSGIKEPLIPPLNSELVRLKNTVFKKVNVEFHWFFHFLVLKYRLVFRKIVYLNHSNYNMTKRYLSTRGARIRDIIEWNRCFYFRVKGLKEIILSPKELNFPWKTDLNYQLHYSGQQETERNDIDYDSEFDIFLKDLKATNLDKKAKIIYCSLGSIASIHFKNPEHFYRMVLNTFKDFDNKIIILSVGSAPIRDSLIGISNNAHIFIKVPQITLLKECDLIISHGGLNSLLESIYSNTPILMYPLNKKWDQVGNASRVLYHKIGLVGNINKDRETDLSKFTETIINNSKFVEAIKQLKMSFKVNSLHDLKLFLEN